MQDRDLAGLCEIETKRLKEQVRRNIDRFPEDFMIKLTIDEYKELKELGGKYSQEILVIVTREWMVFFGVLM